MINIRQRLFRVYGAVQYSKSMVCLLRMLFYRMRQRYARAETTHTLASVSVASKMVGRIQSTAKAWTPQHKCSQRIQTKQTHTTLWMAHDFKRATEMRSSAIHCRETTSISVDVVRISSVQCRFWLRSHSFLVRTALILMSFHKWN